MLKDIIEYIKDNPKGYWFKNKIYGWGWFPVKWQGWVVLLVFIALLVWNSLRIDAISRSTSDVLIFIVQTSILVAILIYICYKKGEKPRWQWGIPKKSENESKNLQN